MTNERDKNLRDDPEFQELEELLRKQAADRREAFFDWLEDESDREDEEDGPQEG